MANVTLDDLLQLVGVDVIWINFKTEALAIKTINLVDIRVIEALYRKIHGIAIHLFYHWQILNLGLAENFICVEIPDKMTMHLTISVEEINKNSVVVQKDTGDKRIWKFGNGNAPVVDTKPLVDAKLERLLVHSESFDVKFAIVHVT